MKQLFLFLLFTSLSFGQSTLTTLKIQKNVTDNTATKVNVQTADGFVNTIAKIDLQDALTFANEASFPIVGLAGKLYLASSSPTKLYRWNGTVYNEVGSGSTVIDATPTVKGIVKLAGDLGGTADLPTVPNKVDKVAGQGLISNAEKIRLSTVVNFDNSGNVTSLNTKENLSNKSTTLTASATLYPNNDAVIAGLATKQNTISPQNVTAGSAKITLGGTPIGASLQPFSINVNEANFAVPQANVIGLGTSLAGKENTIVAGTTAQYYRGDKTFQTLDKIAVGLNLVDNTSDISKPISTATQNVLNNKQNNLQFEQSSSNILTVATSSISWCKLFITSTENFLGAIVNFSIISGTSVDSGQINIQGAFYDMSDPSFFPFVEVTHQTYNARLVKILVIKEAGKLAVYTQINAVDMAATLRWNVNSVDTSININNVIANPANEIGVFTLPNFFYVKANNRGYVQKLNGDIDITGKLTTASPNFTGIPTAPTAPIGTNTTDIATTAFVAQANAGNVKLIGDQNVFGKKTFTNSSNGISINVNNSGANPGVLISNTANGNGLGIINQVNGSGLICENNNSGNGIVSNGTVSSTGFVFAGQNNGLKTFTVNKEGDTVVAKLNVNQILNLANVPTFSSALLANSSSLVMGDVYQVNGVLMIIQQK